MDRPGVNHVPAAAPYDGIAEWYDTYVQEKPLYREIVLPGLMSLMGDVRGRAILDLATGQGLVARALARGGAFVTGVDISPKLLDLARRYEAQEPLGVRYLQDDAHTLSSLPAGAFDGAICSMALMTFSDLPAAFAALRRVLRPDAPFLFAVTHPCYQTPRSRWGEREDGTPVREVAGYYDEHFWVSPNSHGVRGQVGEYHRTLSTYLNTLAEAGFILERLAEPRADGQRAEQVPGNREVPSILLARARSGRG